ncbi:hypothetical protein N9O43_02500, partial [Burkholderiales bacterium]|nr:hypothetical protein [Burkholderiales bacterium]
LSEVVNEDVTITLNTSGSATEGTDYTSLSDIVILAGTTVGSASFIPTPDSNVEGNEVATITLASVTGGSAISAGDQSVSFTIVDSQVNPHVSIAFGDLTYLAGYPDNNSVAEGDSVALVAYLSEAANTDVVIALSTSGDASPGVDFPSLSSITIPAGQTFATQTFTPTVDGEHESLETLIVDVSSVSGANAVELGTQSQTIYILDPANPLLSLSVTGGEISPTGKSGYIDENDGGSLTIVGTLTSPADDNIVVNFNLASNSAVQGVDYQNIGTLTIAAGQLTGSVSFTPIDDNDYEGTSEVIALSVFSAQGGVDLNGAPGLSLFIRENDSPPSVSLTSSLNSTPENADPVTVTATLSGVTYEPVSVLISTSGSATQGTDYSLSGNNIITIPAGQLLASITLTPIEDSVSENDELVTFTVDGVTGGNATENGDQLVNVTLTNVVVNPTVTLSTSATSIDEEGDAITLTATLSSASNSDVTVTLDTSGTASDSVDYLSVENIVIQSGQLTGTTSFSPIDDLIFEGNETSTIAIQSVSGGGAIENGDQAVDVSITDNESNPTITLSSNALTIDEKTSGAVNITATSNVLSAANIVISLNLSGVATKGSDYSVSSESITIPSGQLSSFITLQAIQDTLDEGGSESISVEIISVTGGVENGEQSRTISIVEDALNAGTQAVFNQ